MDTRTITVNLNTFKGRKTGIANLTPDNISAFMTARFVHTFNRNVYVVSGSTFEAQGKPATDPLEVLDASKITPLVAAGDICTGFIMATVDGYDHYPVHSIAESAIEACDQFTIRASSRQDSNSRNQTLSRISEFAGQSCEGSEYSSLAGAIIQRDLEDQAFSCQIGNVGDGMVVILDAATKKVKTVLGARQYCRSRKDLALLTQEECQQVVALEKKDVRFLPSAVQNSAETIQAQIIQLAPHDVIVHLTDGAFEELECQTHFMQNRVFDEAAAKRVKVTSISADTPEEEKETPKKYFLYKESKIAINAFEQILQFNGEWNSFEIGQALLSSVLTTRARRQSQKKPLLECLEKRVEMKSSAYFAQLCEEAVEDEETKASRNKEAKRKVGEELIKVFLNEIPHDQKEYLKEFIKYDQILGILPEPENINLNDVIRRLKETLKQSGDCSTIAIVEVPDISVENLRPFFERVTDKAKSAGVYQAIQKSTLELRKAREAWIKNFENKEEKEEEFYKTLIEKFKNEKCLLESTERNYQEGDVRQNVRPFYKEEEMKVLTSSLIKTYIALGENELLYSLHDPIEKKRKKQEALKNFLDKECISVNEKAVFFDFLRAITSYNAHANKRWDRFFGLDNTKSWRETVKGIRDAALKKLVKEWDDIESYEEKIIFLKNARKMKIFSQHRNNSLFSGAFGRTQAQIKIDILIEQTKIDKQYGKPQRPE
jgi:hypothetical protein